jgi:hypothetical protein
VAEALAKDAGLQDVALASDCLSLKFGKQRSFAGQMEESRSRVLWVLLAVARNSACLALHGLVKPPVKLFLYLNL